MKKNEDKRKSEMITDKQVWKIQQLTEGLTVQSKNHFFSEIFKKNKVEKIEGLTRTQGIIVIKALMNYQPKRLKALFDYLDSFFSKKELKKDSQRLYQAKNLQPILDKYEGLKRKFSPGKNAEEELLLELFPYWVYLKFQKFLGSSLNERSKLIQQLDVENPDSNLRELFGDEHFNFERRQKNPGAGKIHEINITEGLWDSSNYENLISDFINLYKLENVSLKDLTSALLGFVREIVGFAEARKSTPKGVLSLCDEVLFIFSPFCGLLTLYEFSKMEPGEKVEEPFDEGVFRTFILSSFDCVDIQAARINRFLREEEQKNHKKVRSVRSFLGQSFEEAMALLELIGYKENILISDSPIEAMEVSENKSYFSKIIIESFNAYSEIKKIAEINPKELSEIFSGLNFPVLNFYLTYSKVQWVVSNHDPEEREKRENNNSSADCLRFFSFVDVWYKSLVFFNSFAKGSLGGTLDFLDVSDIVRCMPTGSDFGAIFLGLGVDRETTETSRVESSLGMGFSAYESASESESRIRNIQKKAKEWEEASLKKGRGFGMFSCFQKGDFFFRKGKKGKDSSFVGFNTRIDCFFALFFYCYFLRIASGLGFVSLGCQPGGGGAFQDYLNLFFYEADEYLDLEKGLDSKSDETFRLFKKFLPFQMLLHRLGKQSLDNVFKDEDGNPMTDEDGNPFNLVIPEEEREMYLKRALGIWGSGYNWDLDNFDAAIGVLASLSGYKKITPPRKTQVATAWNWDLFIGFGMVNFDWVFKNETLNAVRHNQATNINFYTITSLDDGSKWEEKYLPDFFYKLKRKLFYKTVLSNVRRGNFDVLEEAVEKVFSWKEEMQTSKSKELKAWVFEDWSQRIDFLCASTIKCLVESQKYEKAYSIFKSLEKNKDLPNFWRIQFPGLLKNPSLSLSRISFIKYFKNLQDLKPKYKKAFKDILNKPNGKLEKLSFELMNSDEGDESDEFQDFLKSLVFSETFVEKEELLGELTDQWIHKLRQPVSRIRNLFSDPEVSNFLKEKGFFPHVQSAWEELNHLQVLANSYRKGAEEIQQDSFFAEDLFSALKEQVSKKLDIEYLDNSEDIFKYGASIGDEIAQLKGTMNVWLEVLFQIVKNAFEELDELLDKGLKGPKKIRVVFNVESKAEEKWFPSVLIDIGDTGRGLPENIFENINKKDDFKIKSYKNDGSGMGLNNAKKLIKKLGGELKTFSRKEIHKSHEMFGPEYNTLLRVKIIPKKQN